MYRIPIILLHFSHVSWSLVFFCYASKCIVMYGGWVKKFRREIFFFRFFFSFCSILLVKVFVDENIYWLFCYRSFDFASLLMDKVHKNKVPFLVIYGLIWMPTDSSAFGTDFWLFYLFAQKQNKTSPAHTVYGKFFCFLYKDDIDQENGYCQIILVSSDGKFAWSCKPTSDRVSLGNGIFLW